MRHKFQGMGASLYVEKRTPSLNSLERPNARLLSLESSWQPSITLMCTPRSLTGDHRGETRDVTSPHPAPRQAHSSFATASREKKALAEARAELGAHGGRDGSGWMRG